MRLMIRVFTLTSEPYTASWYNFLKFSGTSPSLKLSQISLALSSGAEVFFTDSMYKDFSTSYAFHLPFRISSHSLINLSAMIPSLPKK